VRTSSGEESRRSAASSIHSNLPGSASKPAISTLLAQPSAPRVLPSFVSLEQLQALNTAASPQAGFAQDATPEGPFVGFRDGAITPVPFLGPTAGGETTTALGLH
jgi:hypothetical protein